MRFREYLDRGLSFRTQLVFNRRSYSFYVPKFSPSFKMGNDLFIDVDGNCEILKVKSHFLFFAFAPPSR